jgi:hypothetical protein
MSIATPGATAQHAEILAVFATLRALSGPVNIVSDSQYVVKGINSIETARLKGDPNSTIFQFFTQAQLVILGWYISIFYYSFPFTYRPARPYGLGKSSSRPAHFLYCC